MTTNPTRPPRLTAPSETPVGILTPERPVVARCTKIDLLRMIGVDVITRLGRATLTDRASLLVQLRSLQDNISIMKHRMPQSTAQPSNLSWVDAWTPPQ